MIESQPEMYQLQQDLYTSLLQKGAKAKKKVASKPKAKTVEKAPKGKTDKKPKGKAVKADTKVHGEYSNKVNPFSKSEATAHKKTVTDIDEVHAAEVKKQFVVPAKRDAEIAKVTAQQDQIIDGKKKKMSTDMKETNTQANNSAKAAEAASVHVDHTVIEAVHKTLHDKPPKIEQEEKEYLNGVAAQAAGKSVLPDLEGKENLPGKPGDVAIPTPDATANNGVAKLKKKVAKKKVAKKKVAKKKVAKKETVVAKKGVAAKKE